MQCRIGRMTPLCVMLVVLSADAASGEMMSRLQRFAQRDPLAVR